MAESISVPTFPYDHRPERVHQQSFRLIPVVWRLQGGNRTHAWAKVCSHQYRKFRAPELPVVQQPLTAQQRDIAVIPKIPARSSDEPSHPAIWRACHALIFMWVTGMHIAKWRYQLAISLCIPISPKNRSLEHPRSSSRPFRQNPD